MVHESRHLVFVIIRAPRRAVLVIRRVCSAVILQKLALGKRIDGDQMLNPALLPERIIGTRKFGNAAHKLWQ